MSLDSVRGASFPSMNEIHNYLLEVLVMAARTLFTSSHHHKPFDSTA
jgi:cell division protein FtsL